MEFSNPFAPTQREGFRSETKRMTADVTPEGSMRLPRKPSLSTNFSYPRLSRHESSQSRSSNGSLPGMTDASDSELSIDEDGSYNTSAGELWDSFWPDNTTSSIDRKPQEYDLNLLQPAQNRNIFTIHPTERHHSSDADDDTIRIATGEDELKLEGLATPRHPLQPPQSQSTSNKSAVTYSVYPRPQTAGASRSHPPRTSSLSFEPFELPPPPRRPLFTRGNSPNGVLKPSTSILNINTSFIPPSLASRSKGFSEEEISPTTTSKTTTFPASPAYPPPPPPRSLRTSNSAFSLRDKTRAHNVNRGLTSDAATASPVPLLPSALPEELPTRPPVERFVSVFEYDSDSESEDGGERSSFKRRITRGLHRKSASEKRAGRKPSVVRHPAFDAKSPERHTRERPRSSSRLNRTRGGSLGRIFGLMGR
ncbi:hypothetical protein F5Y10DRAFT_142516 [Nemania abortiva]|nr:hypothetical protein F5Y10DRAFT_142516 [Nemania abortiva]